MKNHKDMDKYPTDLELVVRYLWDDENKDYYACDKPEGHIFMSLKRLNKQYKLGLEEEVME